MDMCYVGRCKCGQIVAACANEPDLQKDVAKWVAGFIRNGLTIEQMDTEQVRVTLARCKCKKSATAKQLDLLGTTP